MKPSSSFSSFVCFFMLIFAQHLQAQYKQTLVNRTSIVQRSAIDIPLTALDKYEIAVISSSPKKYSGFAEQVMRYAEASFYNFDQYHEVARTHNTLIVLGSLDELTAHLSTKLNTAESGKNNVFLVCFDESAKAVHALADQVSRYTVLMQPDNSDEGQRHVAMSIFGGLAITEGLHTTEQTRIQYVPTSKTGIDHVGMLKRVDAIAQEAIRAKATPGMVVMALKDGQVILNKAYGTHTYTGNTPTKISDIFDLASISKIAATTPVVMHLYETGLIQLDSTIGHYLPMDDHDDKAGISLRSVLLHEAGFTPFIPFYRYLKSGDLQRWPDAQHRVHVADSAYLLSNYYQDVMWPEMLSSPLDKQGKYVYSDISMYVMKEIAERLTKQPMDKYVNQLLYQPIGMQTAGFNPRNRFAKERIVPTELDTSFRKILLQGHVHDEGAAMAGGVAGHAGLFATANDLAIYGQMLLNRGEYGGVRYFQPETIDLFTSRQSQTSRRGLGFDRFDPSSKSGYPSKRANASVFGHTGFTGTAIWIDPRNQLVYIFLSNRVHPERTGKLSELNIRSRIQDVIYEFVADSK